MNRTLFDILQPSIPSLCVDQENDGCTLAEMDIVLSILDSTEEVPCPEDLPFSTKQMSSTLFDIFQPSFPSLSVEQEHDGCLLTEIDRVLSILDSVEEVPCPEDFLEPTPLGPNGLQNLVEEVPVTDNTWYVDQTLVHVLNPLLGYKEDGLPTRPFSMPPPNKRRRFNSMDNESKKTIKMIPHHNSLTAADEISRFHRFQADQWKERFQDLIDFHEEHGHCLVPYNYPEKQLLAQWVKRQRYQYKLKQRKRHSTITDERQATLQQMGFVWDSHKAAWIERFEALKLFKKEHGHCTVPSNYSDRPLASWVKCQRRQYKLYTTKGQRSTMTDERFMQLKAVGFEWNPRNL